MSEVKVDGVAMSMASLIYLDLIEQPMPEHKRHEAMFWVYEWARENRESFDLNGVTAHKYPSLDRIRAALAERNI